MDIVQQRRRKESRIALAPNVISLSYFVSIFTIGVFVCAYIVYVLAQGWALIDSSRAWTHWLYWRISGPAFTLLAPAFFFLYLYELRKAATMHKHNEPNAVFWKLVSSFLGYVSIIINVVLGAFLIVCIIWLGVQDFADCTGSALCSGTGSGATPSGAIIMLIVCWCVMAVCMLIWVFVFLYVSANFKSIFAFGDAMRATTARYSQSEISSELNDAESGLIANAVTDGAVDDSAF
jgi:hypothetical protein